MKSAGRLRLSRCSRRWRLDRCLQVLNDPLRRQPPYRFKPVAHRFNGLIDRFKHVCSSGVITQSLFLDVVFPVKGRLANRSWVECADSGVPWP